jgi:hypothetical protein
MTHGPSTHSRQTMRTCLLACGLALLLGGTVQAAPDLDILASASLGDELGGRPVALGLADDGSVVLGGADAEGGTVVRLDAAGFPSGPVKRLSGTIDDLAVDPRTGNIAVVGDALVVLGPDLEIAWQTPLPAGIDGELARRIAIGELGTIAVAAAGELRTFSADGGALALAALPDQTIAALAVLDAADLVVATGWSRLACNGRIDVAELQGFARDGSLRWSAYGEAAGAEGCDGLAGTRGVDVARGEDGLVYLLAEAEGFHDVFHGHLVHPATNVAFDAATTLEAVEDAPPRLFAYYARFTPAGEHLLGQHFLLPDEDATVRPGSIAADEHGNVHLVGITSHRLEVVDESTNEVAVTEELLAPSGFYQVVQADFAGRSLWRQLELEDASTRISALALAGERVITLLEASPHRTRPDVGLEGPTVLVWPSTPQTKKGEKNPDRDDVGTFGYESGVSGADPSCHCDAARPGTPAPAFLLLGLFFLGLSPRRP